MLLIFSNKGWDKTAVNYKSKESSQENSLTSILLIDPYCREDEGSLLKKSADKGKRLVNNDETGVRIDLTVPDQ